MFVNYRREDAAGYAGRLYDALVARFGDENVFMDIDTIELGSDFADSIDRALALCDVAIALIGRNWLSAADAEGRRRIDDPGDVLRIELERALARGLVVIPACVQGAELPAQEELPGSLAGLVGRQGIELRDTAWRDDVGRLIRRLDRVGQEPTADRPAEVAAEGRAPRRRTLPGLPSWSRKRVLAAAVALGVVGAALAVALTTFGSSGNSSSGGKPRAATPAESRLLGFVSPAIRSDCDPSPYGSEVALGHISCSGVRLTANYHLFASVRALTGWYALQREEAMVDPAQGTCTSARFHGEAPYAVGGKIVGRYFCFVDSKQAPELVWTDARARVGVEVGVWEGTGTGPRAIESLLRQWRCCLQLQP